MRSSLVWPKAVLGLTGALALAACGGDPSGTDPGETDVTAQTDAATDQAAAHPGKLQYLQCAACHAVDADAPAKVGPHLECVLDRQASAVEGFGYSPAFREAAVNGLTWDRENLLAFIENNKAVVPGNAMAFGGIGDAEKREAIVSYLESECSADES